MLQSTRTRRAAPLLLLSIMGTTQLLGAATAPPRVTAAQSLTALSPCSPSPLGVASSYNGFFFDEATFHGSDT